MNRQIIPTGHFNTLVCQLSNISAVGCGPSVTAHDDLEVLPAFKNVPIGVSPRPADIPYVVGPVVDEGVGGFAPWPRHPSPGHHQVAVGIGVGRPGFRIINVLPLKHSVVGPFAELHQKNPKEDDQQEQQPAGGA